MCHSPPVLLTTRNLSCGYSDIALFQALDLGLHAGELVRITGANGTGKSTLLKAIAGLHRPLSGAIDQPDHDADADPAERQRDLCFVGHDNALNRVLTPVENLAFLMQLAGWPASGKTIRDTLAALGLKRVSRRPCRRLSAGQKRRTSLARLWLTQARLWLLDEPASALDTGARQQLAAHMQAHASRGGLVVFTTHENIPLSQPPREIQLSPC